MTAKVELTDDERAATAAGHADREWRSLATTAAFGALALLLLVGFLWNYQRELETIQKCGGSVAARNDPDRGATFEIRLPLA